MGRTLVLHPGALGDVLLAVPALRALRAAAPDDELVLAAQPRIGRLLTALAVVDRSVSFDALGLDALFTDDDAPARLRGHVVGARVISWFGAGDPDYVRRLCALAPGAVVASSVPPPATPVWGHLLSSIGAEPDDRVWSDPLRLASRLVADGGRALGAAGWTGEQPLVMLHPGAGSPAKCWAPQGFAAVAEALVASTRAEIVVHEGPADRAAVAALRARLRIPALRLTEPSLETLAGALGHAALWIGNDSGPSHLAAVSAPALVLFAERNLAWRSWARAAVSRVVAMDSPSRADVEGAAADALALLRADRRVAGAAGAR